eukprot:4518198-Alexandrium_andersonii.AAC.1
MAGDQMVLPVVGSVILYTIATFRPQDEAMGPLNWAGRAGPRRVVRVQATWPASPQTPPPDSQDSEGP